MEIIKLDRYELLKYIPQGICAEVGVATGRMSKIIVEKNNPIELYLIDAWKNFDLGYADGNMVSDKEQESRYQNVKFMFKDNKSVKIIRDYSTKAAEKFENNFFDWVYIDADHSYQGCLNDLVSYDKKVKESGYIIGHDYTPPGGKTKKGFGVNQAVEEFVEKNNYILSCITNENKFASYLISKNELSHAAILNNL